MSDSEDYFTESDSEYIPCSDNEEEVPWGGQIRICASTKDWKDAFKKRWATILEVREMMQMSKCVYKATYDGFLGTEKDIPEGEQCTLCNKAITGRWARICELGCTGEVHPYMMFGTCKIDCYSYAHWECCESQSNKNVPEMEEFEELEVFNFAEEKSLHLKSLEKVDVKALPESEECALCHKMFSNREKPEVLKPCDSDCRRKHHGYVDTKCYQYWLERAVLIYTFSNYSNCITYKYPRAEDDIDEDFLKFKVIEVENDEIEKDINAVTHKISSHL